MEIVTEQSDKILTRIVTNSQAGAGRWLNPGWGVNYHKPVESGKNAVINNTPLFSEDSRVLPDLSDQTHSRRAVGPYRAVSSGPVRKLCHTGEGFKFNLLSSNQLG